MTDRKLIASAISGAGTYFLLGEMGFNAERTAAVGSLDINGDLAKILWSVLAALAPTFLAALPAWIRPLAKAILDSLLPKEERARRAMALVSDTLADCPKGSEACKQANNALQAHFHPAPSKEDPNDVAT